jgi:hypothetical protein
MNISALRECLALRVRLYRSTFPATRGFEMLLRVGVAAVKDVERTWIQ